MSATQIPCFFGDDNATVEFKRQLTRLASLSANLDITVLIFETCPRIFDILFPTFDVGNNSVIGKLSFGGNLEANRKSIIV